jgi:tRNA-dihydrouridine synthase A
VRDFPDLRFTINGGITSVSKVNAALKEGAHGVMVGRAAYNKYVKFSSIDLSSYQTPFLDSLSILDSPWQTLGQVDTAVYGVPSSGLTRRQVLEQYQVYGDSVLGTHGNGRPNVRDLVKPLLNLFHSENGNSLWKRRADAAFKECRSVGSLLEESLRAIPDCVLDSPISGSPESGDEDVFADVHNVLPPPYEAGEEIILCA